MSADSGSGGAPTESAPFTIVNLKEVENVAPKFGLAPGLESRFARRPLGLHASGVSYFRIAPGFRTPFGHQHREQEEIYLVVSGSARAKIGDEIVELSPWDALRVEPTTIRALEGGPTGAEVVAFGAPSHENRDAEPVQGWWID